MFDKIEFRPISEEFHTYYIPGLHDFLLPYKQLAIEAFFYNKEERWKTGMYNAETPKGEVKRVLGGLNEKILNEYYEVEGPFNFGGLGISYQDNEIYNSSFHSHWRASLVSTTYIDPPEKESFEIWNPPAAPRKIKVLKDTIHMMPNWLLHRPLPQEVELPRICFNWTFVTHNRPINKLTGDRW